MKCPHCGYVDVIKNAAKRTKDPGVCGKFFEPFGNSMQLQRNIGKPRCRQVIEIASIIGCPHCKKVFIDF
ncbi:hypothetical protein KAR91_18860 [Candidatus Pacearchaeota archaeon]|nr:hypothetical protein [Candidatus Pacearchaeota archaeon]